MKLFENTLDMQIQNRYQNNMDKLGAYRVSRSEMTEGKPLRVGSDNSRKVASKTDKSEIADQQKESAEQLNELVAESGTILLDIKSVFPFDLFPDELIIDASKVSVHSNYFFVSKEARSIEYKDIFNVIVQHGVFFANLEIVDRYYAQQPIVVKYLKKDDAIFARRLIQGMIIAKKDGIDVSNLSKDLLVKRLEEIGKSR